MELTVAAGTYVVAVSGGVDSVVLLDLLAKQPGLNLVVAHFDHGIRPESADDAAFVGTLAQQYGLPFITERVELGSNASEDAARTARYDFLERVSCQHNDAPIITAHHQDDLLETAIHNLLRGTGRRGLTSLRSTDHLVRPLLSHPKQALVDYALQQKLSWHDDTTNHDERYARNYIRHRLLVRFDADARQRLLALITELSAVNGQLDIGLDMQLKDYTTATTINRRWFCLLPHTVSKEVLATWLRARGLGDFDAGGLERLTVGLKVMAPGKRLDIGHGYQFLLHPLHAELRHSAAQYNI